MKNKKCDLCPEEIKTTFLDKLQGTIVRTGVGESSKTHNICKSCQKEHKDNLAKKVKELIK